MDEGQLLTFKEACAVLRVGKGKMAALLKARALPCVRFGKKITFRRVDLDRFIKKHLVK